MSDRQYKAFISYSHADQASARWLHRRLESYRLPSGLAGDPGGGRLQPIFKDREELPAADDLGEAIEKALRNSEALIVLCSPAAAASPWVAKEIDAYKRLHGGKRVFPVIVAGEPPDNFPDPLLLEYDNGRPTGRPAEPIAADMRREGDGRKLAMLKVAAGLAEVDLDDLVRRDHARKHRRLAFLAAASVVGMVGTSALALFAIDQRNEARAQRAEADGLIEYMLTDLREQLEPVGRLEVLDGVGKRAMDYYARQKLDDLSDSELGRRARATHLVAEVANLRGNNEEALPAFRQAARTTEALLSRNPEDPEAMFNHGQSLFWVGYIAWQHGKLDEARAAMEDYADISRRLAAKDRSNLEWQMEEAYSLSNLGTMEFDEGEVRNALGHFRRSAQIFDTVSDSQGRPAEAELETADAFSWISSSHKALGQFREAIEWRQSEIDLYSRIVSAEPGNNLARRRMLIAESSMGDLLALSGRHEEAFAFLDRAIAESRTQSALDPGNTYILELARQSFLTRGLLHWNRGERGKARDDFRRLETILTTLRQRDPENDEWNAEMPIRYRITAALIQMAELDEMQLKKLSSDAIAKLNRNKADHEWMFIAAYYLEGLAWSKRGEEKAAREHFERALQFEKFKGDQVDARSIALRESAARRLGRVGRANELRGQLVELGVEPLVTRQLQSL